MKKIVLIAVTALFTTATVVTATKTSEKKPPVKKEVVNKEKKCTKEYKRNCSGYYLKSA